MDFSEKVQILSRCGYSDQEIAGFITKHQEAIVKKPNAIDEERFERIAQSFQQLGFTTEDVRKMWLKCYDLTTIEAGELKPRYDNLRALGFTPEQIFKMWSESPDQSSFSVENINEKINNLLAKGFTKEQIVKMWSKSPDLSGFSVETINEKINNLLEKGFTKEQIVGMWVKFPQQSSLSLENINEKINNLLVKGFTKEQLVKMWSNFPPQSGYSVENINEKFNNLLTKGFTKEQIVKMWSKYPPQSGLSIDNINEKFNKFLANGLPEEQVVVMWSKYPNVGGFSTTRLERSLELCQKNDLMDYVVISPQRLAMSPALLEARINFCKEHELPLERWAFCGNKEFSKRYNLTREELIEKYGNKTPETEQSQSVNIEVAKEAVQPKEVDAQKIDVTNQSALQKQPNLDVFNRLKELEARERKIVQELKTIVQEEAAKTELGYNQQTLKSQETKLNQERVRLTETVQKFYQESTPKGNNQQDVSETLSKEVGRLERELDNLNRQKNTYKEWKENYKTTTKSMPLDEQIKKYGKNPRCKELLSELKQVREAKLEILMNSNKEFNHQSASKKSDWSIN